MLKILSWSISNECRYGQVIHYLTITRSILGRWRDGAMTKTRWNDSASAMVQGHDDYGAMVWWRRSDIILHHFHRIISTSSLHRVINSIAHALFEENGDGIIVVFNCYDLSIIMHASIKCIYRISIYLMLRRS